MAIKILRAAKEHATILSHISVKTFYETYGNYNTADDMKNYTEKHFGVQQISEEICSGEKQYFMAYFNSLFAGYAVLKNWEKEREQKSIAEVARIYVLNEFKGKNIGSKLIAQCISTAKQDGYKTIQLGVWQENKQAIHFYEKMGFRITGEQTFLLGEDLQQDWIMSRKL